MLEELIAEIGVKNKIVWKPDATQALNIYRTPISYLFGYKYARYQRSGIKRQIDADPVLRKKAFRLFLFNRSVQKDVKEAYTELTIRGFFIKRNDNIKRKP